jgi:hypothetical protein
MKIAKQLIMACHITGVYDVNRNNVLANDDFSLVENWVSSLQKNKISGILFHNNFSQETCELYKNNFVQYVKITHDKKFNPNIYRYYIYLQFLKENAHFIEDVFFTDVNDVIVKCSPFDSVFYKSNTGHIFCGDEPSLLNNDWMLQHATHLRSKISDYAAYEQKHANDTLLNCGIIGGNSQLITSFINKLWTLHKQYNIDNTSSFTGDMGAFNYLIRTEYNNIVLHGMPINSVFKQFDLLNNDCWFCHK